MNAVFFLYGDDSSDEKRERCVSVAVVVGDEGEWRLIEEKWKARLNGIPFHANDVESDQGDFSNTTHEENKALYKDLVTYLVESDLAGWGFAIDLVARRNNFPDCADVSYYNAFSNILYRAERMCAASGRKAKFTFDISTENHYNAGYIYHMVRNNDKACHVMFESEVSFVQARECTRVQVGDLMAFESMKALDNTIGPKKRRRRSWDALVATQRFEAIAFGEEWFKDLRNKFGLLEKHLGYSDRDFADWLIKKKRQYSLTNLFEFTNEMWKKKAKDEESKVIIRL
jgi:hypothetical protein